ncbi:MAG: N-acetylmuramoyl-L-alanine amidase, partial [Nitrospirota bacterium]
MKRTLFVSLLLVFLFGYSEASKGVTVEGYRYWSSEGYTRVVINLNDQIEFTQNRISNPDRLYFDLKNCILSKDVTPFVSIDDGILKKMRVGQFDKGTVRVVLDLQKFERFNVIMFKNPYRLVIDVFSEKGVDPVPDTKQEGKISEIKRVVIDPGHGGNDPGAIGPRGLMEKDVVLDVAKKLGALLKDKYNMEVIFTRDRDVFIPLEERTAIANSKKADFFISIHANASRKKGAKGIETYFLNWTDDEQAMRVAARENAISYEKMREFQKGDFLQMILQDKERDYKNEESLKLAGSVQNSLINSLIQDYDEIHNLGVKWALFYVLVDADMPSILVETS